MAPRNSRSVNRCGHAHLACQFPINVTVPGYGLKFASRRSQAHSPSHAHFARQHWRFRFGWRLLARLGAIMGKSEVQKTGGGVKHKELYATKRNASLLRTFIGGISTYVGGIGTYVWAFTVHFRIELRPRLKVIGSASFWRAWCLLLKKPARERSTIARSKLRDGTGPLSRSIEP